MDMAITGKGALVLASSKGLGLATAQGLAAEGVDVFLCGRNQQRLKQAANEINDKGQGTAHYMAIDLSEPEAAYRLHQQATQSLKSIDIVINNCGGPPPGAMTSFNTDTWRQQFDSMIMAIVETTNLCVPAMKSAGWGRVITIASSGVQQPIPGLGLSNSLRSVLVGWSKTLATEYAADGITINMLLPGRIATDRLAELDGLVAGKKQQSIEQTQAENCAVIPIGRYGRVEEFAAVAVFLASAPASYITGSTIRCDGGAIVSV